MDARFEPKRVCKVDAVIGVLQGVCYNTWGMKELDYVMRIMATVGVLATDNTCWKMHHEVGPDLITFQYCMPFDWHFHYHHAVDDHNTPCHSLPSLEDSWRTERWQIRALTFLLVTTEINTCLVLWYFVWLSSYGWMLLDFCMTLGWMMVEKQWVGTESGNTEDNMEGVGDEHYIIPVPAHAKIYTNRHWICTTKGKLQHCVCKAPWCKKQVRTCCRCRLGYWLCTQHILEHVISDQEME